METTATTVVTALINEARQRYGQIAGITVPTDLFEQVQEEVVAAGGAVGFDSCEVDGVTVTAGATEEGTPLVLLAGSDEPVPLTRAGAPAPDD